MIMIFSLPFFSHVYLFTVCRPHKQNFITTLNGIFGGAEVVISEMFAAELPDRTNIRLYVQQTLSNGKFICCLCISRSHSVKS